MSLSRRSVLRNLGALSAVQTLNPLSKCFGLQSVISEIGPKPDSILVMFEGPWLISDVKSGRHKGHLMALCVGDPHVCQMGLWDSTSKAENPPLVSPVDPQLEAVLLGDDAVFTATRTPAKLNSCSEVFDETFRRPNPHAPPTDSFVYIRKKKLTPKKLPGDRVIYIPVPDSVHVAGQIPYWSVNDTSREPLVEKPDKARMYITVILEYKASKAHPTTLALTDGSGTHFEVKSSHKKKHLIFRLTPGTAHGGDDSAHVKGAFDDLVKRLLPESPTALSVVPGSLKVVVGPSAAGLSPTELGIDPKDVIPSVPPPNSGGLAPRNADFPNCQGGGMINCDS